MAVSDPLGITAQGVEVLENNSLGKTQVRLREICAHYAVTEIVIGLPLRMDGTAGEAARRAEAFGAAVQEATGIPVIMLDERLTSRQAEKALLEGGRRRSGRRKVRDLMSAVLILESYLDRPGRG